jgi:hypothetical protein
MKSDHSVFKPVASRYTDREKTHNKYVNMVRGYEF